MKIDREEALSLSLEQFLGESVAVLGIKGSGKSNTAAVLAEEMLEAGLPLVIVDIAGEYWGLKERYPILVVGRGPHVDVDIAPAHGAALAHFSLGQSTPLILDLGDFSDEERLELLLAFCEALWQHAGELRRPYAVFLEEAHNFVPQAGAPSALRPLKAILTRIATEGRKRGLSLVLVGQRSARLEKNILTQAGILLLHHVRHPADVKVYEEVVPRPRRWVKDTIHDLATGEALLMIENQIQVIQVRERHTYHAGYTPGLADLPPPELCPLADDQLSALRELLAEQPRTSAPPDGTEELRQALEEAQARCLALEAELEQLRLFQADSPTPVESVAIPDISAPQVPPPHRSERAAMMALRRQQRSFRSLLHRVGQLPKLQQVLLAFLVGREGESFGLNDLARMLGYSLSTLRNHPPSELSGLGLIERTGTTLYNFRHRSTARQELAHRFPDLNAEELLEELLEQLPSA